MSLHSQARPPLPPERFFFQVKKKEEFVQMPQMKKSLQAQTQMSGRPKQIVTEHMQTTCIAPVPITLTVKGQTHTGQTQLPLLIPWRKIYKRKAYL